MQENIAQQLEKQAVRIALLEEELNSTNQALKQQYELSAGLAQDLENAIIQLRQRVTTRQSM